MKRVFAVSCLLTVVAYYIYIPLPSTISDPWKLMLLDAAFRGALRLGKLVQNLGFSHHIHMLNFVVNQIELQGPESSEGVRVRDMSFRGVQVRVFESTRAEEGQLKRGVVYLHGGGWSLCSAKMRSYDFLCRKMAEELNAVVVSVDYPLAPDAHFPKQYDDALQASRHFLTPEVLAQFSVDPERVAVSGDSAGGNLAAAVAQELAMDNTTSVKFKLQVLIYPALQALDFNTPSYQQNQDVPILYRPLMATFWLEYLDGDPDFIPAMLANNHSALDQNRAALGRSKLNWTLLLPPATKRHYKPVVQTRGTARIIEEIPALLDVRAAPLLAKQDVLGRTPRAHILTCEHDVLRDDGLMYGRRLQEAYVTVTYDHYEDGFHGCMVFAFWPAYFSVGQRMVKNYIRWLEQNL